LTNLTSLVTYLTTLIYNSIEYSVGNGDLACVSFLFKFPSIHVYIGSSLGIMHFFDGRLSRVLLSEKME
jgi:hypothetical protein